MSGLFSSSGQKAGEGGTLPIGSAETRAGASNAPDAAAGGDIKVPQAEAETRGSKADPKLPSMTSGQGLSASDVQHGGVAGKMDAGMGGGLGGPFRSNYK